MPKILGKDYSDRIERMQSDLEQASGKPVRYQPLPGTPQELLCRGQYKWDDANGSLIELVNDAREYDCAHELAHGLIKADGYAGAFLGKHDPDKVIEHAVTTLADTVIHPLLHSTYLAKYAFAEETQEHYRNAARELTSEPGQLKSSDNSANFLSAFHATGVVEMFFAAKNEWDKFSKLVKKAAPNTWLLAKRLVAARRHRPGDSPLQIRSALVEMIRALDNFLREYGPGSQNLIKRAIIEPILSRKHAEMEAGRVFNIDFYKSDRCHRLAYVKMVGDGSYCHLWECQDQHHVDWIKRNLLNSTAREFLALLDPAGFKVRLLDIPE